MQWHALAASRSSGVMSAAGWKQCCLLTEAGLGGLAQGGVEVDDAGNIALRIEEHACHGLD